MGFDRAHNTPTMSSYIWATSQLLRLVTKNKLLPISYRNITSIVKETSKFQDGNTELYSLCIFWRMLLPPECEEWKDMSVKIDGLQRWQCDDLKQRIESYSKSTAMFTGFELQ